MRSSAPAAHPLLTTSRRERLPFIAKKMISLSPRSPPIPPDVCFLDIQMPRLDGFEVLARLPRQPMVIFTTAYSQYALDYPGER